MDKKKCFDCGRVAVDTCPLCGLSFCRLCAEREGENCCFKAREEIRRATDLGMTVEQYRITKKHFGQC